MKVNINKLPFMGKFYNFNYIRFRLLKRVVVDLYMKISNN